MKNVIGIDLGTTNCCVAIVENGRPKVIEDEKGYNILPSYIAIKGSNKFIVGHGAKAQAIANPQQTLRAVKRLIGRKINTPEVEESKKRMGFEILEGPNYDVLLKMGDVTMGPVDASSVLLKCIKGIAEKYLGREVTEAVITCPAYFTNAQRKATIEAGQKAGLKVLRLLNEPTAAALAYGYKKELNKKLLIYDLGGGTFDVSILEVGNNVYEVLATNGDSYLGGEDLDNRVVDHLASTFKSQHRVDLRSDRMALQRLKDAAERAKCELSFVDKTQIMIPHIHGTSNLQAELTREALEKLTDDLIKKTFAVVTRTLEEANLAASDIDDIILVGGQTRMPRIQEMVKSFFGKPPCKGVHPDEAVAIGAAVHADALTEDKGDLLLLDVTPFSLGIDSAGDIYTRIVAKNSTIPVAESRTFTTVVDNQEKVKIVVRQGENKKASENSFLGEFVLSGIRRAPKMEPKIDVVFRIDSNGILNVSAKDRFTGERQSILIKDYFERATNPVYQGSPVIGEQGAAEEGATANGAGTAEAGGKARGLFKRLVGGLGRKKEESPELEPVEATAAASEPVEYSGVVPMTPGAVPEEAPPPPPPRIAAPSFDPYSVIPVEGTESPQLAPEITRTPTPGRSPKAAAHPPPPVSPSQDDPFAQPVSNRPFSQHYTDPFAAIDKNGAFPSAGDTFSMSSTMPDPFALDSVDPFAVQEKRAAPAGRTAERAGSPTDDLLGSFDLDKLVDELSEGMPTVNRPMSELPVPKASRNTSLSESGWSGWQTPSINNEVDDAFALSEAGVDPFAVIDRELMGRNELGGSSGWDDPLEPMEKDLGDSFPSELANEPGRNGKDDRARLPSGFIDEHAASGTSNLPSGFIQEGTKPGANGAMSASALQTAQAQARGEGAQKKPAKLKIAYKRVDAFVSEYSENLSRGGTFIKTPSPLDLGRECLFELTIPNRDVPIYLSGVVVWSSKGMATLEAGQEPGMGIKYMFEDAATKRKIEQILDELRVSC